MAGLRDAAKLGDYGAADLRTSQGGISLDWPGGLCYNRDVLGVEIMLDPMGYNFIRARELTAFVSSAARPMLAGAVHEPQVIPVDVRIRLVCDDTLVPAKPIPGPKPVPGPRPIGTLLDCYM